MSMYKNNIIYKIYKEIQVYTQFIKVINDLKQDRKSFWNVYSYSHNIFYTKIGCDILLPDYTAYDGDISRDAFKDFVDKHYDFFEYKLMFVEVLKRDEPLVYINDNGEKTSLYFISMSYKFKYLRFKKIFRLLYILLFIYLFITYVL